MLSLFSFSTLTLNHCFTLFLTHSLLFPPHLLTPPPPAQNIHNFFLFSPSGIWILFYTVFIFLCFFRCFSKAFSQRYFISPVVFVNILHTFFFSGLAVCCCWLNYMLLFVVVGFCGFLASVCQWCGVLFGGGLSFFSPFWEA